MSFQIPVPTTLKWWHPDSIRMDVWTTTVDIEVPSCGETPFKATLTFWLTEKTPLREVSLQMRFRRDGAVSDLEWEIADKATAEQFALELVSSKVQIFLAKAGDELSARQRALDKANDKLPPLTQTYWDLWKIEDFHK